MNMRTPGPWKRAGVAEHGIIIIARNPVEFIRPLFLADIPTPTQSGVSAEAIEANANIMVAGPDMLAALKHVRDNCLQHPDEVVDAAIEKAETGRRWMQYRETDEVDTTP